MDAAPQLRDMRVKAMSQRPPAAAFPYFPPSRAPALGLHSCAPGPKLPLGPLPGPPPCRARRPAGPAALPGPPPLPGRLLPSDHRLPPGRSGRNLPAFLGARRVREPESGASL
jgi:hypothetical protein